MNTQKNIYIFQTPDIESRVEEIRVLPEIQAERKNR